MITKICSVSIAHVKTIENKSGKVVGDFVGLNRWRKSH